MKFTTALIAATLLLSISSAQAGFVHTDWKVDGDQKATLHEETGIEWLKLNQTSGMSINQVTAQLNSTYEGWRFPTDMEVNNLLTSFFTTMNLNGPFTDGYTAPQAQQGFDWVERMGLTFENNYAVHARGMHVDNGEIKMSGAYTYTTGGTELRVYDALTNSYTGDYSTVYHSVFLVSDGGATFSSQQDPSINTPASNVSVAFGGLALSSMGLMLFGGTRRRAINYK